MKTKILIFLVIGIISSAAGQNLVNLTFTAVENTAHVRLDSVRVINRTQGGTTTVFWPDTSLSLQIHPPDLLLYVGYATLLPVGIPEPGRQHSSFRVYQNYTNTMADLSDVSIYIPRRGPVAIEITDLQGRMVLRTDRQLDGGSHTFRFYPGNGSLYILTASWNGINRSIKLISPGQHAGGSCRFEFTGSGACGFALKSTLQAGGLVVRQSGILDKPIQNTSYIFQFAANIPCPGMPTVVYEGQVYNTIQILSQCWLKENMNVGNMINGSQSQTNNGITEKYCYNNSPDSCTKYGGLYKWDEMMQYTDIEGARGICPPGWHVPTNEELKLLEGAVDSLYGIGAVEWDSSGFRGYDAGKNLKTTSGWYADGNGTDRYGFSVLPGGDNSSGGQFCCIGTYGLLWTSTMSSWGPWFRYLYYDDPDIASTNYNLAPEGRSVRCLHDY